MPGPRESNPRRGSTMPVLTGIGESIARRRRAVGLTQQTLADLAGVSRSTVQALEYGRGAVQWGALAEVADVLGLRIRLDVGAGEAGRADD